MGLKTAEKIKLQHAKECGFDNWKELIESLENDFDLIDFYYNGIRIAYCEQEVERYLEVAAEKATVDICNIFGHSVNSQSITNIKIDLT